MGSASSKAEKNEALRLCRARRRLIKQAIGSRYNFAAAHVSYTNSLKTIGVALRRFAEADILIESSLSTTSAAELDKTPSHSSYPSPSPSHIAEVSDSPLHNETAVSSPVVNVSHMRSGSSGNAVTVKVNLDDRNANGLLEDESLGFSMPMPPPPPPPFEAGGSWDYFDPSDHCESVRFVGQHNELDVNFDSVRAWNDFRGQKNGPNQSLVDVKGKLEKAESVENYQAQDVTFDGDRKKAQFNRVREGDVSKRQVPEGQMRQGGVTGNVGSALEQSCSMKEKDSAVNDLSAEREDPSEYITHRAKDFLSSIKDIEHRFFRASESGKELSRMLEASNIRVGFSEAKGRSAPGLLAACQLVCCRGKTTLVSHEPAEHTTKIITWKRTTSSRSPSSRNPLATDTDAKDDVSDSGSDFFEDFCMISGSHSCTLDRMYAWERKLHDEVKASEAIRKEYDRKCGQLRHQFAKDCSTLVIDKTRAVVKDLHSRIRVAIHSVDSISKRIEKMRDEELQPQLLELIQGLIRMWKIMLECHHAQYITISLAYHSRSSTGILQGDVRRQIMDQLQQEIEYFGLSFTNWVNSHASYVEALNGWLQNCILHPQERSRRGRPFSPRGVLAPPIFVLCCDWSAGIKALPSEELSNAIKTFLSDLRPLMEQQAEQPRTPDKSNHTNNAESRRKDAKNDDISSNLCCMHSSLTGSRQT